MVLDIIFEFADFFRERFLSGYFSGGKLFWKVLSLFSRLFRAIKR